MSDKPLCKIIKKDYLKTNLKDYVLLVKDARYICKKCGRTAKVENRLCKPVSMKA